LTKLFFLRYAIISNLSGSTPYCSNVHNIYADAVLGQYGGGGDIGGDDIGSGDIDQRHRLLINIGRAKIWGNTFSDNILKRKKVKTNSSILTNF